MGNVGNQKIENNYIKSIKKYIPIGGLPFWLPTVPKVPHFIFCIIIMIKQILSQRICSDLSNLIIDYVIISDEQVKNNFKSLMLELWVYHMVLNIENRNLAGMLI